MKQDIDRLMQEAGFDALLITGSPHHNPSMAYLTGLAHLTGAYVIKKSSEEPILIHTSMEREEAARTGLRTVNMDHYNPVKLIDEAGGDRTKAGAKLLQLIFEDLDVSGRIALYGKTDIGPLYGIVQSLSTAIPTVEFVGEALSASVLDHARATKDDEEVERIRAMGEITTAVVADVAGFLTTHRVKDGILVDRDGNPLTVGEVKRRINLWLAMRGAENPHGTIFAIGRNAGIPHSAGTDSDTIPVGVPIVFDLYPVEGGGGYYFDHTRTWCLGFAPDDVQEIYTDVLDVYQTVLEAFDMGTSCRQYQVMTCELFEARGHKTVMGDAHTLEGYVHSLGHGLGLAVHERPLFSIAQSNHDLLLPRSVITYEPGLYYPERNIGVRIEDTLWVRPDGRIEPLSDYPKDLVLKLPGV